MSDIGSRTLSLSAISTILGWNESNQDVSALQGTIVDRAFQSLGILGIASDDAFMMLHATLLWVEYRGGNTMRMRGWGDGALLCLDSRTGNFKVYIWDQPQNTPPYPLYILVPEYWEKMGDLPLVQTILSGNVGESSVELIASTKVRDPDVEWDISEYDIGIVFSDGFSTFFPGHPERNLDFMRILMGRILETVPTSGFLSRCMRKSLRIMRSNATHMDDLSASAIWVYENPSTEENEVEENIEVSDEPTDLHSE